MIRKDEGFTMVELLVSMVIFILTIAAASGVFSTLLNQFKQQGKTAETQVESIMGLELLRKDIRNAGFGLPWIIPDEVIYDEVPAGPVYAKYNDAPDDPPRAFLVGDGDGLNGSDELVIKSSNISTNGTAHKWTRLGRTDAANPQGIKRNGISGDAFENSERVIVVNPGGPTTRRTLVFDTVSGNFVTEYGATANFTPENETVYVIYGINSPPAGSPRMPFNRADYYISNDDPPDRCAPGTGVLLKNTIQHADGMRGAGMPILDCVADFQVTFWLDRDEDGVVDAITDVLLDQTGADLAPDQIRNQLKEVRVYVVAHEGQKDVSYDFSDIEGGPRTRIASLNEIFVSGTVSVAHPVDFADLSAVIGDPEYKYYRWKLYKLSVFAENLL